MQGCKLPFHLLFLFLFLKKKVCKYSDRIETTEYLHTAVIDDHVLKRDLGVGFGDVAAAFQEQTVSKLPGKTQEERVQLPRMDNLAWQL